MRPTLEHEMPPPEDRSVVRVLGFRWSSAAHDVKDYLARNRVPYYWIDLETNPGAHHLLESAGAATDDLPLVLFPDGSHIASPSDEEIATKIGLSTEAESPFYDLVVAGGGPAGLAAAVYGASEGLRILVVERDAAGGQMGMSGRVENYLGFPGGLSGAELARRAVEQARGFGVEIVVARSVTGVRADGPYRVVVLDDGDTLYCHTALLAMGVSWRVLEAPGCRDLIGRGVYYGATAAEAPSCRDQDVYLLGGGNSAGQAAMELAEYARSVTLLAPEPDFGQNMSEYLLERLEATPNVRLRPAARVVNATGRRQLERIEVEDVESGEVESLPTGALFVFIGAQPQTEWLDAAVARDERGFVICGRAALGTGPGASWPLGREPYPLECTLPGVFVAGDVRADSVKRLGAAAGEGATAIQYIHAYLRDQ